jgi:2-oxo-3-hexenedioate decarboxylase
MSPFVTEDPRVAAGMLRQLADRATVLDAGARPLGWKIGFGSSAAMAQLGTTGALVGFLTDRSLLADAGTLAIGAWGAPRLECELAVRIDDAGAIDAVAPAIELVDFVATDNVEAILAGNIFQRRVVLGAAQPPSRMPTHSLVARDGATVSETDDPLALPGEPVALVAHVARYLESVGERLQAGEWIITGMTMAPPLEIAPGETIEHRLDPFGSVSVVLTH